MTQTDTEWGRIWDALPAGFPVYPDAVETEEAGAGEPVSATFSSPAAADEIATWLQSRLELATFSTEALSGPLEDGSFVLDSVGDEDCRIETTVAPAEASRSSPSATARPARSNRRLRVCGARATHRTEQASILQVDRPGIRSEIEPWGRQRAINAAS